eukprot:TRINITY_DN21913_c0_g1_i1.p1 TRINITY_DN21913_c0_g1~~TRINITY_DN21913_c0_g1_i1.p1  ORF type:complete len:436 (+),score=55.90 TRINITY_DN21913_c0_g1_i1:44-1351(+)
MTSSAMDRRALLRSVDNTLQAERHSIMQLLTHNFGVHTHLAEQEIESARREVFRAYQNVDTWNRHHKKTSRNPKQLLFSTQWEEQARRGYSQVCVDVSKVTTTNIARPILEFTAALCGAVCSGANDIVIHPPQVKDDPFGTLISKFTSTEPTSKISLSGPMTLREDTIRKVLHLPGSKDFKPNTIIVDSSVDFHTVSKRILLHIRRTRQSCNVYCIGEDTVEGLFAEMGEVTALFHDQQKSGQHRLISEKQFEEISAFLKSFDEPASGTRPPGRIIGGKVHREHHSVGVAILRDFSKTVPAGLPSVILYQSCKQNYSRHLHHCDNVTIFTTDESLYSTVSSPNVSFNDICDYRVTAASAFAHFTFPQRITHSTLSGEVLRSVWYPPFTKNKFRLQQLTTGLTPPWEIDFLDVFLKAVLLMIVFYVFASLLSLIVY